MESVYEQVREPIQQGDFVPGERVLEEDIASRFKISRTPVREALRRLEDEGLLVLEGAAARMAAQFASAPELEMRVDSSGGRL